MTPSVVAVGSGPGGVSSATLWDVGATRPRFSVQPFPDGFVAGVRTAVGDVTGDGVPDLIAAAGPGGGPHVRVYDGVTGQPLAGPLGSFYAFDRGFRGGVSVAAGDVNGDGAADVVVGAGAGGGPAVAAFDGRTGARIRSFFAYDPTFAGGVSVAAGDVNDDGRADIVTGAGPGGGPHVEAFSGASGKVLFSRYAYDPNFSGGVSVAVADTAGDGLASIVIGAGPGGGPHVKVIAPDGTVLKSFYAAAPTDSRGVAVAAGDTTGDGRAEVMYYGGGRAVSISGLPTVPAGGSLAASAEGDRDAVGDWNAALLEVVREAKLNPPVASRILAVTHLAMFDAADAVTKEYQPYLPSLPAPAAGASAEAAATAAAHRVLSWLLPVYQTRWDALLAADALIAPAARTPGEAFGFAVGDAYKAARQNDGASADLPYTPGTAPGDWQPTPPAFAPALVPQWGMVTPFGVASAVQFAPAAPPALDTPEYAAALNAVKAVGSKTSTTRTAEQTQIALFWADGGGTVTPPGHWNVVLGRLAATDGGSFTAHARAFALLNAALGDAAITSWAAKYSGFLWRPVTAVRAADTDGNAATDKDAAWEPLLATPPFPAYTSGHSTFSSAAAEVLTGLYGAVPFRTSSDALPDVSRTFPSFTAAAAEAGVSRIYGGIHFPFDNTSGLGSGKGVGDYDAANLMKPNS